MHGWYSKKMAEVAGTVEYTTPDGGVVECTAITKEADHGMGWDDVEYRGEVVRCIRPVQPEFRDRFH